MPKKKKSMSSMKGPMKGSKMPSKGTAMKGRTMKPGEKLGDKKPPALIRKKSRHEM